MRTLVLVTLVSLAPSFWLYDVLRWLTFFHIKIIAQKEHPRMDALVLVLVTLSREIWITLLSVGGVLVRHPQGVIRLIWEDLPYKHNYIILPEDDIRVACRILFEEADTALASLSVVTLDDIDNSQTPRNWRQWVVGRSG